MSLRIIRAGLLDTVQDSGRYGHQHLGINPGGAMDRFSAHLANAILGKELNAPVLELHFPAAQVMFDKPTVICLTGAHFDPVLNGEGIPLFHPVAVSAHSLLQFRRLESGVRCYMATLQDLQEVQWLGSASTNMKAGAGGYQGRALQRYDMLPYGEDGRVKKLLGDKETLVLPWTAPDQPETSNEVDCLMGPEWHWLTTEAQESFRHQWFEITLESDRMGYRLAGSALEVKSSDSLVSSPVTFGTVQLLPNGQLIVLMADHQTTGGYPRIAQVPSADLSGLAQRKTGSNFRFRFTDLAAAEEKILSRQKYLHQLQIACKFRLEEFCSQRRDTSA